MKLLGLFRHAKSDWHDRAARDFDRPLNERGRKGAALMGVDVRWIYTLTFALGSALAAIAGALLGPIFLVNPTMGNLVGLKAFAIVILGGLGNITGATLGGFVLALVEEFGAGYLSSEYRDAFGFLVIIAVLALRPQGFFALKSRVG